MAAGLRQKQRRTADWVKGKPISEDLLQHLCHALEQRYPGKVRRALLVCPVAVEHVIDNEADARETIRRLEAHATAPCLDALPATNARCTLPQGHRGHHRAGHLEWA